MEVIVVDLPASVVRDVRFAIGAAVRVAAVVEARFVEANTAKWTVAAGDDPLACTERDDVKQKGDRRDDTTGDEQFPAR